MRGAKKRGRREPGLAFDERLRELAGHVVVERQHRLHVRDRNVFRDQAQIEAGHRPLKMIRIRIVETDGAERRGEIRAIRARAHSIDEHLGGRQSPLRVQIVSRVAEVHRVGPVEFPRAARKTFAEIEVEIEDHVPGDIRGAIGTIQPPCQVDARDVHGTRSVPAGDLRVEGELPLDGSARSGERDPRVESRQRSLQRRIEARFDRDVLQAGHALRTTPETRTARRAPRGRASSDDRR